MWNLVVCLIFLIVAIIEGIFEYRLPFKYQIICTIIRFICLFGFGFMLSETVKWLCGIETLIF